MPTAERPSWPENLRKLGWACKPALKRDRLLLDIHRPLTQAEQVVEEGVHHGRAEDPGHHGRGNGDPGRDDTPEDRGRQPERPESGIHVSNPSASVPRGGSL